MSQVTQSADLEQLYATAPIGLCFVDHELRFVRINERLAAINGVPVADHVGRTIREILPEIADTIEPIYRRVLETGVPELDFEVKGVTQAEPREERSYLVSYHPVVDDGVVLGVNTVVQDVTDSRRVQESAERDRRLLQAVIDGSRSIIYVKDIEGRYVLVNREFGSTLGVVPGEAVGKTDFDLLPRDLAKRCIELDRSLIDGAAPQVLEETFERADGTHVYLSQRFPLTDSEGTVYGICGISTEVTESKRAQQELANTKERYELAVQAGSVGVFDWDLETNSLYLDPIAWSLLGYDFVDVPSTAEAWLGLVHPEDRAKVRSAVVDHLKGKTPQLESEHRMLHKSGAVRWALLRGTAVRNDEGWARRLIGTTSDVTETRLLREELLTAAAREQQRIGQELHDVTGQELTGLGFLVRSLVAANQEPELAGIASRIADGIDRALSNVRVLANGLVPVQVDADGLMAALENLADRMNGLDQVSCRFDCTDIVLVADNDTATHLYRIAQEAVTNALRHGNASQVVISLERDVDCIRLTVRDDGKGVDPEPESGTGLRIMRFRADMIGATLSLESPPHGGLRVVCSLPGCEGT